MRQIVKVFVGPLLLAVLVGCGSGRSKSGAVTGKLTYKGQPVGGAALLLYAVGGNQADPITIPVDDTGAFRISDVPPGDYKVVVQGTAGSSEATPMSPMSLKNMPPEKQAEMKAKLEKMKTAATIPFPKKYKDPKTTDLKCNVTDRNQTQDLELKD